MTRNYEEYKKLNSEEEKEKLEINRFLYTTMHSVNDINSKMFDIRCRLECTNKILGWISVILGGITTILLIKL